MNSLVEQSDIESAVAISLGAKARSKKQNGYWADSLNDNKCGSLLWTLERETMSDQVLERAEQYASEALNWILVGNYAERIEVSASAMDINKVGIVVTIDGVRMGEYAV